MKPSLTNFMEQPAPTPRPEKPKGEVIKNMTYRTTESRRRAIKALLAAEDVSFQSLMDAALVAEFERRGLRF